MAQMARVVFFGGNCISESDQDGLERVGSPHGYWHTGIYASGDRLVQADAGMDVAGPRLPPIYRRAA